MNIYSYRVLRGEVSPLAAARSVVCRTPLSPRGLCPRKPWAGTRTLRARAPEGAAAAAQPPIHSETHHSPARGPRASVPVHRGLALACKDAVPRPLIMVATLLIFSSAPSGVDERVLQKKAPFVRRILFRRCRMANVNLVVLMGNLGKDPELRYTQRGTPVATFSLATSEGYTDQTGARGERTDWHRIVVWGTAAEACKEYLHKGRLVHVEGSLRTRSYDDNTGHKRGVVEVVARRV